MAVEDVLDDGEPEASAALLAARGDVDAVEALSEPRQMLRRDPWSLIDHRDGITSGLPADRRRLLGLQANLGAFCAIAQRVLHEVLEHLHQLVAVGADDGRAGKASDDELAAGFAGKRL